MTAFLPGVDIAYPQRVASGGLIKRVSDGVTLADIRRFDVVFIKATQGTSIKDAQWDNSYAMARKFGKKVVAYHFNDDTVGIPAQADFFLSVAKNADAFCIDQEGDKGFTDAQAQAFINHLRSKGRKCGLYHSASGFGGVDADWEWAADYRLESLQDGDVPVAGWDAWQFSSEGGPNGAGLDLNWIKADGELAAILGLQVMWKTDADAALAALKADVLALTVENGRLQQAVLTAQAERDEAKADAVHAETERDELALSLAEADTKIEALEVAAEQHSADQTAARRLLGLT